MKSLVEKLGITPGPWEIQKDACDTFSIGGLSIGRGWDSCDDYLEVSPEDERLIAAAPEMLEALIELADWYKQHTGLPPVKAFSVIKKATGKTGEEVKEIINR